MAAAKAKNSFEGIKDLRVRIAPSPTGSLHVGTARTALFNYLTAKKYGGTFILRIEDTDLERSEIKFEKDILDYLKWLGIEWDEGVETGGKYGPYRQSERLDLYEKYVQKLLEEGKAYHCFCTPDELEAQRSDMMARGMAPIYSGRCAQLTSEEVEKNKSTGKTSIIRFRMPSETVTFEDLVRGKVSFDTKLIGDIAIAKDLRTPLYNFAVVVDDELMKISHVIRGEDHLSNTPKQIMLQKALGFKIPAYGHLPLLLGTDRSKLSKRHGTTSIKEYKEAGYLPEAIFNFIALLGWNPGNDEEVFDREALVKSFTFERIQKSGAIFNIEKLNWLNSVYIKKLSPHEMLARAVPFLEQKGLAQALLGEKFKLASGEEVEGKWLERVVALEQPRLKKLSDIGEATLFFFKPFTVEAELLHWKSMTDEELRQSLEWSKEIVSAQKTQDSAALEAAFRKAAEEKTKNDLGALLWPLRVALSGQRTSPGPFEIIKILGREETLKRIQRAIDVL